MIIASAKRSFYFFLILFQIAILTFKLLLGSQGLKFFIAQKYRVASLKAEIQKENESLNRVQDKIDLWKSSDFVKEKFARQKLHMSRPNEEIILYS